MTTTLNARGKLYTVCNKDLERSKLIENIKTDFPVIGEYIGPLDIDGELLSSYFQAVRHLTVTEIMKFMNIAIMLEDIPAINYLNKQYKEKFDGWLCFGSLLRYIRTDEKENTVAMRVVVDALFIVKELVKCLDDDSNNFNKEEICVKIAQFFRDPKVSAVVAVNWDDEKFIENIINITRDIHPDFKERIVYEMSRDLPQIKVCSCDEETGELNDKYTITHYLPPYEVYTKDPRTYLNNYAFKLGLGEYDEIMDGLYISEYIFPSDSSPFIAIINDDILEDGKFDMRNVTRKYKKMISKFCVYMLASTIREYDAFIFKGDNTLKYIKENYIRDDYYCYKFCLSDTSFNVYFNVCRKKDDYFGRFSY